VLSRAVRRSTGTCWATMRAIAALPARYPWADSPESLRVRGSTTSCRAYRSGSNSEQRQQGRRVSHKMRMLELLWTHPPRRTRTGGCSSKGPGQEPGVPPARSESLHAFVEITIGSRVTNKPIIPQRGVRVNRNSVLVSAPSLTRLTQCVTSSQRVGPVPAHPSPVRPFGS
jgi:hypothetical protein